MVQGLIPTISTLGREVAPYSISRKSTASMQTDEILRSVLRQVIDRAAYTELLRREDEVHVSIAV